MSLESILAACAAKAYKTDPAGVASGVVEGIAFRASIPEGTLEMSVNLPEANLAKLQSKLSGRYPDNTVAYRNFGIVVMLPEMESLSGEDFLIFLGTAAKEAGKIVILDDNFKSIKDAIWYGRTIYHNILKFCRFQLVINVAAVVVSAIAPFFGVEEPLKVTHLLFVNLVMDGLGAIMLGNEPAQERYMSEPPRRRDESIVSKSMMAQIVTMGLWLTALSFVFLKVPFFDSFFASTEQKLSAYFVLFIWSALLNAFNVRSDSFDIFKDLKLNPGFMQVFVIIVLVQAFIVNAALIPVPVFGWISNMCSCVPFPPAGWAAAILLAFTMIPVDILRKVIVGRK